MRINPYVQACSTERPAYIFQRHFMLNEISCNSIMKNKTCCRFPDLKGLIFEETTTCDQKSDKYFRFKEALSGI